MSRFERGTSLRKKPPKKPLQIAIHLRSIHEAIPRLCGFLLKNERWFLQILEHSPTTLPKGDMAAMFTSAKRLNPRSLRNDIFLFIGWRRLYKRAWLHGTPVLLVGLVGFTTRLDHWLEVEQVNSITGIGRRFIPTQG